MKAITNIDIYDYHKYRPDSYVLFDKQIREVGSMKDFRGAESVFDGKKALLMPSLLVGHAHIYGTFFKGIQLSPFHPQTFTQLLKQLYWRIDGGLDLESSYYSARISGIEHIKNGVTTLLDHHASGTNIRGTLEELRRGICDDTGMRALFCFETSDRFNVDDCIAENLSFAKERSEKHRGLFGLHASLSVNDETLRKVGDVIGDIPAHVHVAESLEDEVKSLNEYGKRIVHRFKDFGILNEDSILAHCVNIDDSEAEIIADSKCIVAINPTSNMNTAAGIADPSLFKKYDIPVMVGNDSLGTNIAHDYLNVIYTMHLRQGNCYSFGYENLLDYIRNGYEYTGKMLGIKLGKIEPGYAADMITIPYKIATRMNQDNAFNYVVDDVFNNFHPRDVWSDGDLKMEKYETIWDEEQLYAHASESAMKVWQRIGGE
jgi:cytosine/adenosine deaminase-related metal-dependent hydrolase